MLTPYLTYIKIAAIAITAIALIWAGIWFRGVLSERDSLRISEKAAVQTANDIIQARNRDIQLQEGITNAVKNIRVVSNNYIQSVENGEIPDAPDGATVVLVAGGVLDDPQSLPVFTNRTTGRTGTVAPPR